MERREHSLDELTFSFVDVTEAGGRLSIAWDTTAATVKFAIAR
jgi:hypothetical protein